MGNDPFAALAHPIRREIVERLSGRATTVGEASRDLGVSKPTITRPPEAARGGGRGDAGDRRTEPPAGAATGHARRSVGVDPEPADPLEALFDAVGEYLDKRADRR
jgi:hypothetical protein